MSQENFSNETPSVVDSEMTPSEKLILSVYDDERAAPSGQFFGPFGRAGMRCGIPSWRVGEIVVTYSREYACD